MQWEEMWQYLIWYVVMKTKWLKSRSQQVKIIARNNHTHIDIYIHTHTHTHICTHTYRTYRHTHKHTHIHTYTHTRTHLTYVRTPSHALHTIDNICSFLVTYIPNYFTPIPKFEMEFFLIFVMWKGWRISNHLKCARTTTTKYVLVRTNCPPLPFPSFSIVQWSTYNTQSSCRINIL